MARPPQPRQVRGPARLVRGLAILAVALAVLVVAVGGGAVALLWALTPSVSDAPHRVDALLAAHASPPLAALPDPDLVGQAVIATENSRFSSDVGVDLISLVRTGYGMLTGSPDQGAATLEIQLAKNLYTPKRGSLSSKIEQIELAFKLDAHFPKDRVLLLYLNAAYFGHGYYGLQAAAHGYFGVAPEQLSWAQASLVAGLVQAPSAYDPYIHLDLAKSRQRHVLDRLAATGILTRAQADSVYAEPLHLR